MVKGRMMKSRAICVYDVEKGMTVKIGLIGFSLVNLAIWDFRR